MQRTFCSVGLAVKLGDSGSFWIFLSGPCQGAAGPLGERLHQSLSPLRTEWIESA